MMQLELGASPPPLELPSGMYDWNGIIDIVILVSLGMPFMGLYNIWQTIVRSWPRIFYTKSAVDKIESVYPNAFSCGNLTSFVSGIIYITIPILVFSL